TPIWERARPAPKGTPDSRRIRQSVDRELTNQLSPTHGPPVHVGGGLRRFIRVVGSYRFVIQLDSGGRGADLSYFHSVYDADGALVIENTSLLRWLGWSGQTSWRIDDESEVQSTARVVRELCLHLEDAVTNLIADV
ncbi:MAG TPA: hypothetical protein VK986_01290, partial [Tepidisphaeraceae bacterium]|nr:hypothetical protein [Tepidisphaeraceae bacterium]